MTTKAEREIRHGQKLAADEAELVWGWGTPAGRQRALRRAALIADGAGLCAGVRVLEIGCGTGMFTEMFAATGAGILAVDISDALLMKARQRGLPQDKVRFLNKRFEDCDVDGSFDAVVGSSVLHHLDIEAALQKIFNLLSPGGTLSFTEPNMLNPQVALQLKFRRYFEYVSPDETAFKSWQISKMLCETGFREIEVHPFDWLHPATPPALVQYVMKTGTLLEKLPGLRQFSGSLYIKACK